MAAFELREGPGEAMTLALSGRLDAYTTGQIWRRAIAAVREAGARPVIVDAANVEYCDGAGVALYRRTAPAVRFIRARTLARESGFEERKR